MAGSDRSVRVLLRSRLRTLEAPVPCPPLRLGLFIALDSDSILIRRCVRVSKFGNRQRRYAIAKDLEPSKAESDHWREVVEAMQRKTMAPRRLPKKAPSEPKDDGAP